MTMLFYTGGYGSQPIENYDYLPVRGKGTPRWQNIGHLKIPGPFRRGDVLDLYFEFHGTNDDLRNRKSGVAWVTQAVLSPNDSNLRNFYTDKPMNWANGQQNVSVGAHHSLVTRKGFHQFEEDNEGPLFVKVMSHAKSTAARSGDKFKISRWRGIMVVKHHMASSP